MHFASPDGRLDNPASSPSSSCGDPRAALGLEHWTCPTRAARLVDPLERNRLVLDLLLLLSQTS
jgi:hypothetical protein